MADLVWELINAVKVQISDIASKSIRDENIDEFSMSYDEESQTWTFEISFNSGDERTVKIKLDVNPD